MTDLFTLWTAFPAAGATLAAAKLVDGALETTGGRFWFFGRGNQANPLITAKLR